MHKKHAKKIIIALIINLCLLSGCIEFDNINDGSVTYVSHPVEISYTIKYGYWINLTGEGSYQVTYDCDTPEVISGTANYELLHKQDYTSIDFYDNEIINWDISSEEAYNYPLGIQSNVRSSSFMIADLNGKDSYTTEEIMNLNSTFIFKYLNSQSWEDNTYINPGNNEIILEKNKIIQSLNSDNSFLIGLEIFKWLKENTQYREHLNNHDLQTDLETLNKKTGDCDDLSVLYISLCRSAGIPARLIKGILIEEVNNYLHIEPHAWVEIFTGSSSGKNGWIPVECAGEADDVSMDVHQYFGLESANHLRLYQGAGTNESLNISMSGPTTVYYGDITPNMEPLLEVKNFQVLDSKELKITKDNYRSYQ